MAGCGVGCVACYGDKPRRASGVPAMLRKRGLPEARAWHSGHNGQGPWWNSGASHMNHAFPKAFFDRLRLVSMSDTSRYLQRHS